MSTSSGCSLGIGDQRILRLNNMQNSPANVWRPMTSFYSDVEPLLKHSPVALHLSPATRILKENTASWRSMPNTGT